METCIVPEECLRTYARSSEMKRNVCTIAKCRAVGSALDGGWANPPKTSLHGTFQCSPDEFQTALGRRSSVDASKLTCLYQLKKLKKLDRIKIAIRYATRSKLLTSPIAGTKWEGYMFYPLKLYSPQVEKNIMTYTASTKFNNRHSPPKQVPENLGTSVGHYLLIFPYHKCFAVFFLSTRTSFCLPSIHSYPYDDIPYPYADEELDGYERRTDERTSCIREDWQQLSMAENVEER